MINYKKYKFILTNPEEAEKLHKRIWAEMTSEKKKENIRQIWKLLKKLNKIGQKSNQPLKVLEKLLYCD